MTTKPDPCYEKAYDDEPVFVLRAQDALAPDIVRQWVRMAARVGVGEGKLAMAELCARDMERWQKANADRTRFPD